MKQLAQRALDVQSACNLSGIIHAFSSDVTDLRALLKEQASTESVNKHPMCVLYSTQIAYLTGTSGVGCENAKAYSDAYAWAEDTAKAADTVNPIESVGGRMVRDDAPEDWSSKVFGWFWDNDQSQVENHDDQGGYPSDEGMRKALRALNLLEVEE
jgi:hypothetical protein